MTAAATAPAEVRLLSPRDVAWLFGVNEATVRRWARDGQIPKPVVVGHSIRWHPDVITSFAKGQATA